MTERSAGANRPVGTARSAGANRFAGDEGQTPASSVPDFDWQRSASILEAGGTVSGAIPVGVGVASIVRIPVPGTNGLHIELSPRGWTPRGGTTSTLFIQDLTGRRQLRLDYGYNVRSGRVDFHWNQSGVFGEFGISNHTPAGRTGAVLHSSLRYFRYAGRVLVVIGAATDIYSIVVARRRWRQAAVVAGGWAGAWAGCRVVGGIGAIAGSSAGPGPGTAIGGVVGCIAGGIGGYTAGSWVAGETFDRAEETFFGPVPEIPEPEAGGGSAAPTGEAPAER